MTNAKVHQGFRDDKKIEKHGSTFNTSSNIYEKKSTELFRTISSSEVGKVIAINEGFCFFKMIKCRRRQLTDPQKLIEIVNGRFLVFC